MKRLLIFVLTLFTSVSFGQTIYYCGNVQGAWTGPAPSVTWNLYQSGTSITGNTTDTNKNCTQTVTGTVHTDGTFTLNAAYQSPSCLSFGYNMIPGMSQGVVGCETATSGDLVWKAHSCQVPTSEGASVFKSLSGGLALFDASILPSATNWSGRTVTEVVDNQQYTNCYPIPTVGPFGTWYVDSNNDIRHPTYDAIGFKYPFSVNAIRLGRPNKNANCVISQDQTMYIDCDSSISPNTAHAKYEKHNITITIGPVNLNVSRNGVTSGDYAYGTPQKNLEFLINGPATVLLIHH